MFGFEVTMAARELGKRKLRTLLTTLVITLGAMLIFSMNMLLPTMMQAFQSSLLAASGQVDMTVSLKTGETFSRASLNAVRRVLGVANAAGLLSRTINIPDKFFSKAKVGALTLTGIDPTAAKALRTYNLVGGRFLRSDDAQAAVLAASLADMLGLSVGGKLRIPTTDGATKLNIVGILPARTFPGNEEILVTLTQAQKLFDLPDRINTIEANLDTTDGPQRQVIFDQTLAALGKDYTLDGMSSGSELITGIQTAQAAFNLFGFLALFMGGFIILNTFRTIVAERRHDIGMMRAIGAGRRTIITLILIEGVLQGVIGTLVGMGLGYLLGLVIVGLYAAALDQFVHMKMGAPVVSAELVVGTVILSVGVTLLAGLLPAISATRVSPLEALRPNSSVSQRIARGGVIVGAALIAFGIFGLLSGTPSMAGLGCLAFLIGLILVSPALVRPIASALGAMLSLVFAREATGTLAQSNLARQPSRAAVTASATMIGLAIIVGMAGMAWSLTGGFLGILQRSLGSDFLIMPPSVALWRNDVGAKQTLTDRLRAVPGVGIVSAMRYAGSSANGHAVSVLGIEPKSFQQVSSLTFQQGDVDTAFDALSSNRSIIVNGIFAAQTKVKAGDTIQLSTPTGVKPYFVAGVAGDYLNAKLPTAYIAHANMQADFRKTEDIFIQLNLAPGANAQQVEARLQSIVADYPQFSLVSGKGYIEQNKQIFDVAFGAIFVLLGVLVLPSLIALLNTLAIGVIERTREIGMLRAIGSTRRQVRRIVMAESLLLAGIGTALGLLAGLYLGYVMVMGLSAGGYPVEYSFPYMGLVAAIAIGLFFGVIAAILPARQASRMDIIRALQYE